MSALKACRDALRGAELTRRFGRVRHLAGLAIEADGPDAVLGEMCTIAPRGTSI